MEMPGIQIQDTYSVDQSQGSYNNAGPSSVDYASDAACSTSGVPTPTSVSEIEVEVEQPAFVQGRNASSKGKEVEEHSVISRQSVSGLQYNGVSLHRKMSLDISSVKDSTADSSLVLVAGISDLPNVDADFLKGAAVLLPSDQR